MIASINVHGGHYYMYSIPEFVVSDMAVLKESGTLFERVA